jgi:hypothetical protein
MRTFPKLTRLAPDFCPTAGTFPAQLESLRAHDPLPRTRAHRPTPVEVALEDSIVTEIIKVQRPRLSKGVAKPWLLFDKAHAHVEQRADAFISDLVKGAVDDTPAGYFQVEWTKSEGWKIGAQVLAEDWLDTDAAGTFWPVPTLSRQARDCGTSSALRRLPGQRGAPF